MKTIHVFLLVVLALICAPVQSINALVISSNDSVVYDEVSDLYWIRDLSIFTEKTHEQQIRYIEALNDMSNYQSPDWDLWHMATLEEISTLYEYLFLDIHTVFKPTKLSTSSDNFSSYYYGGRINHLNTDFPDIYTDHHLAPWFHVDFMDGSVDIVDGELEQTAAHRDAIQANLGAWVVASPNNNGSSPEPIPEPATIFSMIIGLAALALIYRKGHITTR